MTREERRRHLELEGIDERLAECLEHQRQVHREHDRAIISHPEEARRLIGVLMELSAEHSRLSARKERLLADQQHQRQMEEMQQRNPAHPAPSQSITGNKRRRQIILSDDDEDDDSVAIAIGAGVYHGEEEFEEYEEDVVLEDDAEEDEDNRRWVGREPTAREREIIERDTATARSLQNSRRWGKIWSMVINYKGWRGQVRNRIAFAADDIFAAICGSVTVMMSQCQSDKTIAASVIAALAQAKGRPNAILVSDVRANAQNVAANVALLLSEMYGEEPNNCVHFLDGSIASYNKMDEGQWLRNFRRGDVTLVVPTYASAMDKFADFLDAKDIRNMHLTIDEADQMFKNEPNCATYPYFMGYVAPPKRRRVDAIVQDKKKYGTEAERKFFQRVLRDGAPAPGKRVSSLCLISATHMGTVRIIDLLPEFKAAAQFVTANDELLEERGYSAENDMKRWEVNNQIQTIDEDDCKGNKDYGMKTDVATRFFEMFRDDRRRGKMMLVATSRLVKAAGMTLSNQAQYYLENIDPTAACIIVHGGGVFVSTEPGTETQVFKTVGHNRVRTRDIGEAVKMFDGQLWRSVVVFGFNMVGRSASIRSDLRVITHMFIAYGKRSLSNWYQVMMRPGGRTAELRRAYGFEHVVFLAPPDAFEAVIKLRKFTKEVFEHAQAGRVWSTQEYDGDDYEKLFNSSLKVAEGKLNVDLSIVPLRPREAAPVAEEAVELEEAPQPVVRRRRTVQRYRAPRVVLEEDPAEELEEAPVVAVPTSNNELSVRIPKTKPCKWQQVFMFMFQCETDCLRVSLEAMRNIHPICAQMIGTNKNWVIKRIVDDGYAVSLPNNKFELTAKGRKLGRLLFDAFPNFPNFIE